MREARPAPQRISMVTRQTSIGFSVSRTAIIVGAVSAQSACAMSLGVFDVSCEAAGPSDDRPRGLTPAWT